MIIRLWLPLRLNQSFSCEPVGFRLLFVSCEEIKFVMLVDVETRTQLVFDCELNYIC